MIIRFLLAVFAATLLLVNAADQDMPSNSDEEGEKEIDAIVVTASRMDKTLNGIAGATSVVSSEAVQHARQQLSLDESMARVPGMFFQNRYNSSQDLRISIRGFGSRSNFGMRGIKILVDDIPETLADGQTQVDSIDLGSDPGISTARARQLLQYSG